MDCNLIFLNFIRFKNDLEFFLINASFLFSNANMLQNSVIE